MKTCLVTFVFGWSFGASEVCHVVLSVYAFSFFKALTGIVSYIESILNLFFFWGGGRGGVMTTGKFIGWTETLFAGVRRLEVRRIREFNFALLGRWRWRLLIDSSSLWFRVLASRYGVEGGAFRGEAARLEFGGETFMHCVGRVGLAIMLAAFLVMESIRFFGWMSELVGCRLELDLVVYMTYQCLRSYQFFICVNWDGEKKVGCGVGGGGCLCGRSRWWGKC